MSRGPLAALLGAACGVLFGFGLVLSGMASPRKVLGYLTLDAAWDPTLLFVMGGALCIGVPGYWMMHRRGRPWMSEAFAGPANKSIDARLLVGAGLFGVGWGLAGYCPGPAIVGASLGQPAALIFLAAMLAGAWAVRKI